MIRKALKLDGKQFRTTKQFKAKRPSEYWLLFFKRHVLLKQRWKFKFFYLLALAPILITILFYINMADREALTAVAFISVFITIIVITFLEKNSPKAFVPINAFGELAKFIIYVKGDVYKNLISLRLNAGQIEAVKNLLKPEDIGFKNGSGTTYKPYQLERFFSQFVFKEGSSCIVSLYQISMRVTSTKRRRSGKTKTKTKHKHKFFYQLILKLKESDYSISRTFSTDRYDISVKNENGYNLIKVKLKEKVGIIASEVNYVNKHDDSIFIKMLKHLINKQVLVPKNNQKLIN
ncbi:hypothetical protein [Aquimarina sp. 2201CG5-10]|uniref:hypothetical protein n=1 Tax=Aquimarina callyspongiae TaxID=3098150 RepID=UPI002AB4F85D|nr:hypothetical protein [Aquimarina sp. 2201CG5-10]MDY8136035.1 hypothetical protein [Aquimarina sp. 2201CG5-10]